MTDPSLPKFARLRELTAQIEQAHQRVTDLERERNAELVQVIGEDPEHGLISAAGRAMKLSRQQTNVILRLAGWRRRRGPKHST